MQRLTIKYLVVLFILISSLVLGSGCELLELLPDVDISPSTPPPPETETPDTTAPTRPDWTQPPSDGQGQLFPNFVSLVAKVKPSVVVINTKIVTYDFFNRPITEQGAGSGWVIDEAGYVVSNNHVVEGAESITVILDDGRTISADIVGTDPLTDIAVIKIQASNLVKANIGDSTKLEVGEWVLAVGNSLNLGVTPSQGIVRSLGASIAVSAGQSLYGLIGTSAPINPGNSGGPLVNMRGEVVGITTVKIAMVGVEAMGWAISTEVAMPIIEELIKTGYVVRSWLGIAAQTVDQFVAFSYRLAVDEGAFIAEVVPGSPADKAGLEVGDVVVSLNGKEVTTVVELVRAIHDSQIGQSVEIIYWRGDSKETTYAILIEKPPA